MDTTDTSTTETQTDHPFLFVGIGASAGGVPALQDLFASIPADSGMAYAVVLHLSQAHESNLDAILQHKTTMPVLQVQEQVKVEPNHVYVIPPGKFLELVDGVIRLQEPERTQGARTSIDYFFRTLADAYGRRAIAMILSGTGSDGTLGIKRIKELNGFTMVQDPVNAAFDGMPRSAIATGLVDVVLPIPDMAEKLLFVRDSTEEFRLTDNDEKLAEQIKGSEAVRDIITLLRIRTGNDFSNYKQPTILRRIARQLQIHELNNIPEYLTLLRERPEEIEALVNNLFINVTNFFRDKESFEVLEKEVIPKLFADKSSQDTIRVWVPGCASGEEAYSIAMLLLEYADGLFNAPKIQIFASDVDEDSIAEARQGRYTKAITLDVSEERLLRFFITDVNGYRIRKEVRELILFTPHNLLRDPPFSRIDLISCRNVFIYLNRLTQEKVLQMFHFALRRNAFLFLGSSESAEGSAAFFVPLNKKQRIYIRLNTESLPQASSLTNSSTRRLESLEIPIVYREKLFSFGDLHHRLVEQYAPPSVLVNEDFEIVHLSEHAGRYLRFVGGDLTSNLLKVLHQDLRTELRAALFEAQQDNRTVEVPEISVNLEGEQRYVTMTIHSVATPDSVRGFLLILFDEHAFSLAEASPEKPVLLKRAEGTATEEVIRRLEEELQRAKDRLRNTIEQYETSLEELKASNEELQAINEELRSASEELETSKEEMQSINEELTTVNQELKGTLDEVNSTNADLQNLMISTQIGTIFLDRKLQIKRFTPEAQKLFNIIPSDIGRPIAHVTHQLKYDVLNEDANQVLKTLQAIEKEVRSVENNWYIARFLPYRTMDDRIDGVVLTFLDITENKQAKEELRESEEKYYALFKMMDEGFCIIEKLENKKAEPLDFRYIEANPAFEVQSGMSDVVGKTIRQLLPGEEEEWFEIYDNVLRTGKPIRFERTLVTQQRVLEVYAFRVKDETHRRVAVIFKNITERKQSEAALRDANRKKNDFLAILAHELRNPLTPIQSALKILNHSDSKEQEEQARNIMERQLRKMVMLVEDLLEISRITSGKIRLQKQQTLLSEVVIDAVETVEPLMKAAGHHFTLQIPKKPIYLYADAHRVTQIVVNLLTNAIKYTNPGGQIHLSIKKEYKKATIRLKDNGIGIPRDRLENIFELFNQIEPIGKELQSGLGIGLNLVKTLVEVHGGEVVAYSAGKNRGSEFLVHLPLLKIDKKQLPAPAIEPIQEPEERIAKEKRSHILVVDDEEDITEVTKILLEMEGYKVQIANTGASAIEVAASFKPEAALVDLGLPDIDGYEVASRLRKAHPDLLLIAHSGWGAAEDRQRSREAGFDHHLVKPSEIEEIIALLTK